MTTTIYIPVILKTGPTEPALPGEPRPDPEQEEDFTRLLVDSSLQRRPELISDGILNRVAQERAMDMIARGYFSHINPDGFGPNYLVTQAGFKLPPYYGDSKTANYIESIAASIPTAQEAWDLWLASPAHRAHVLGETEF